LSFLGLKTGIEAGKEKLRKHGLRTILWGYFFPGSASLLSTAAGVLNMNFKQFLTVSIFAQSFWSLVWGTIAYFFGIYVVEFIVKYFIFVLIGIGIVWGANKMFFKK
jgi:membrane protein DedA with SNARE-associated domain